MSADPLWDCIIIGGGPAGLVAATYLARFRRKALLIDSGHSRLRSIACTYNVAGFPDGISGRVLLEKLRQQARRYRARIKKGTVSAVSGSFGQFVVVADGQHLTARTVLLASGVANIEPEVTGITRAMGQGIFRACPICDGFEAKDRRVAVLGHTEAAAHEALFLRIYTAHIVLLTLGRAPEIGELAGAELASAGIDVITTPATMCRASARGRKFTLADSSSFFVDVVYGAEGTRPQTQAVVGLGIAATHDGCIKVGDHQRTSVAGIFAAGDVIEGLDQINVAFGHGAVAATAIHNDLRKAEANSHTKLSSDKS